VQFRAAEVAEAPQSGRRQHFNEESALQSDARHGLGKATVDSCVPCARHHRQTIAAAADIRRESARHQLTLQQEMSKP